MGCHDPARLRQTLQEQECSSLKRSLAVTRGAYGAYARWVHADPGRSGEDLTSCRRLCSEVESGVGRAKPSGITDSGSPQNMEKFTKKKSQDSVYFTLEIPHQPLFSLLLLIVGSTVLASIIACLRDKFEQAEQRSPWSLRVTARPHAAVAVPVCQPPERPSPRHLAVTRLVLRAKLIAWSRAGRSSSNSLVPA